MMGNGPLLGHNIITSSLATGRFTL